MPAKTVRLSPAAAHDLRDIQSYTLSQCGPMQWHDYLNKLDSVFEQLSDNPALGSERNEVRTGFRSIPVGAHVVWYRVRKDDLEVVRVLHGAMDPDTRL